MPRTRTWRAYVLLAIAGMALFAVAAVCGPAEQDATPEADTPTSATAQTPTAGAPTANTPPLDQGTQAPSVFGFPETARLPSPSSGSDAMLLGGTIWVDARPASGEVVAYIGGAECGRGKSAFLPDGGAPFLLLKVASAAELPGCGTPGQRVEITINGRLVNEPAEWQPGMQQPLNLVVGPPFAQFWGTIRYTRGSIVPVRVVPYVDGIVCGAQLNAFQGDGEVFYQVVVDPAEIQPGCGREGAVVTLRLEAVGLVDGLEVNSFDMPFDAVPWQAGSVVSRPDADVKAPSPLEAPATSAP